MPRIRTIKPEFWNDKRVASWPLFTRLLYIGLWTAADDHGRGSAEPARLAAEIFPYDLSRDPRETLASIAASLDRLAEDCRITLYEVGGETYYEVANWSKHQRVDNAGKPKVPTPSDGFARPSRDSRETRGESRLEQGTGNREQGTGNWPGQSQKRGAVGSISELQWKMADGSVRSLSDEDVRDLEIAHPNIDVDHAVRQAWLHFGRTESDRPKDLLKCVIAWLARERRKPQERIGLAKLYDEPASQPAVDPIKAALDEIIEREEREKAEFERRFQR